MKKKITMYIGVRCAIMAIIKSDKKELKSEILRTILDSDGITTPSELFIDEFSLKLNCERMFRIAVELGLLKAMIWFKEIGLPFIPDDSWCDHCQSTTYKIEIVKWLYDNKYFEKSVYSPNPTAALTHFTWSGIYNENFELLNFLRQHDKLIKTNFDNEE